MSCDPVGLKILPKTDQRRRLSGRLEILRLREGISDKNVTGRPSSPVAGVDS